MNQPEKNTARIYSRKKRALRKKPRSSGKCRSSPGEMPPAG